ncbi:MAG TPA: hypothetical protein VFK05_06650 [Polyangiaceae bacterium]|nr:hypothetical protein [Polyangiaceae bacterium]
MSQRRRQAASLVSLLVVTLLFVWACSSGDREEARVTTSGGAGSVLSLGGAAHFEAGAAGELDIGGAVEHGVSSTMHQGGAGGASLPPVLDAAGVAGDVQESHGGVGAVPEPPPEVGGNSSRNEGGTAGFDAPRDWPAEAGTSGSPGPSVAGAPAASEPVCDPADDHSTPDMFLPCEVSTALYVCRNCHSNPPAKGVFTSYVTYADIKANAAQIYGVIKSGTMPWPPYTLSSWQKTTALKWLGKNGSCAIGADKPCQ